jgi:alkane 1-monooxygenase
LVPATVAFILAVPVDELIGDDWSKRIARSRVFFRTLLYIQFPAVAIATCLFAYYMSEWTFLGATINEARARTATWEMVGAGLVMGLGIYSIVAINIAHELVHRNDRASVLIARWLLSFSQETAFSIEHVFGHHVNVGTPKDPTTAPRGQSFWRYFLRILHRRITDAWRIEKRFLENRGQHLWSLSNRVLTGQLLSAVWLALFVAAAGWRGAAAFVVIALLAKLNLELSNYIEHYGLIRVPGTPVSARHSWNSARRTSNILLFNLPRHADHHVKAGKNYWELEARRDAPQLPFGHFTMVLIALVPPLFRRVMREPLADWETRFASREEQALLPGRVAPAMS